MAEGRLPKIAIKWMPKQKTAQGRPKKNWMEGIRKTMKERNLNEGQWEDRKQWSLGVGQHRTFRNRHTYIHYIISFVASCCYSATHVGGRLNSIRFYERPTRSDKQYLPNKRMTSYNLRRLGIETYQNPDDRDEVGL